MKTTIIARNREQLDHIARQIREAIESEVLHEVIIRPFELNISAQQRKLYWFWIGIIGNELGYSKDELHLIMKKRFLVKIFMREHEGYAEMVSAVQKVKDSDTDTWKLLSGYILAKTSIMDCKVKEMKEYLTEIDRDAAKNNIRLPLPADRNLDKRIWKR